MASFRAFNKFAFNCSLGRASKLQGTAKCSKLLQSLLSNPNAKSLNTSSKLLKALSQERMCSGLAKRNFRAAVAVASTMQLTPLVVAAGGLEVDSLDSLTSADDEDTFISKEEALSGSIMTLMWTQRGK